MKNITPNVLIVDDELQVRLMIRYIIEDIGYRYVGEASDGDEAISKYIENKPDIVILDIKMPNKTGDEALKEIKEISPDACVMMLTAISDEETMKICLNYGATCYITKDTPINDIRNIIKETWETYSKLKTAACPPKSIF